MNKRIKLFVAAIALLAFGCHHNTTPANITMSPEAGTSYKSGEDVKVSLNLSGAKIDSVVYLLDSARYASKKDSSALVLKTDTMRLGNNLITAKVYTGGQAQEVSTNIVLMAAK